MDATTSTSTSTSTTTLPCPPDGFAGLRCALAGGLDRIECVGQSFPRRRVRRFERLLQLVDRAERASRVARTRRLLERTARSLRKLNGGVQRDGERGALSGGCTAALEAMFADGQSRAEHLAFSF